MVTKHILIPIDGSEYGKTAIEYGVYLAKKLDARLTGLHVIDINLMQIPALADVSGAVGLPLYHDFLPAIERGLEEKAEAILHAFSKKCSESGVQAEVKKAAGIIEETIIETGKHADWIILAQRGEHFHFGEEGILGSTAETVVRTSGKPVMVTPASFHEISRITLAYDGSPSAESALMLAAELTAETSWPLSVVIVSRDKRGGTELAEKMKTLLNTRNIKGEIDVIRGNEDRELVRLVREGNVELMIMGAYGHNRLRELILGSTTSSVIRKSTVPVFLTR
ncbi:MAG: universal stress protein [Deltaproteobacteria bacterium]|nr:universal stress protein [Deltaproteobacteria bacterium]